LSRGPRENRFRPAIDPLFRTAAQVYGPGAVGVVLSGGLDDGTAGLATIKQLGGVAVVQDPADATYPSMPESALRHVVADHVAPASALAALLVSVVDTRVDERPPASLPLEVEAEVRIAREENPFSSGLAAISQPSPFACPECHGVLLRLKAADPARFRCHTGHAYTMDSLVAAVNEGIEDSYWITIRALQEGVLLLEHLRNHLGHEQPTPEDRIGDQIRAARAQIAVLRQLVNERANLLTSAGATKSSSGA
jgi:two-component system chemotaxis response regulator CheB